MKKIRWGILGCGYIAHKFVEGLRFVKNAEVIGVASKTAKKAEEFADKYKIPKFYTNYEDLARDSDIDVIYVATTHNLHFENTKLCLENGKAVLCEKPFTVNAHQAKILIDLARAKKLFLMEAMCKRFYPAYVELKKLLSADTIGNIKLLRAEKGYIQNNDPDKRIFNLQLAGGSLLDLGVYPVSLANFVFRKSPDKIISHAHIGSTGIDEYGSYLFQYNNDQMAVLASSVIYNAPADIFIIGTKGYIHCISNTLIEIRSNNEVKLIEMPFESNGYNYEIDEVCKCIHQGKVESDIMPLCDTLEVMETMDALRLQWNLKYPGE